MNDINRELPPELAEGEDRQAPLDTALLEFYLYRSRSGDKHTTVDSVHLAQLCNEVWRRRRAEREHEYERCRVALAGDATKAIANVGHSYPFEGHQHEATAIVQVANMLAELMQWRSRERTPPNMGARDLIPGGMTVRGTTEAMAHLDKLLAELEATRRIISELERMGWLMKAATP